MNDVNIDTATIQAGCRAFLFDKVSQVAHPLLSILDGFRVAIYIHIERIVPRRHGCKDIPAQTQNDNYQQ
jgi:hypothetical protein